MIPALKKHLYAILFLTISTIGYPAYCQSTADSYEKLWSFIDDSKLTVETRLNYLDVYIEKAQKNKNVLHEFKALNEKRFYLNNDDALHTANEMYALAVQNNNDSLTAKAVATKALIYYVNRDFNQALKYAIQAEDLNIKTKNYYHLNLLRISIGNIYFHTRHYQKAKEYFLKANNYYKIKKDYNHIQGLASSLYSLNKVYWQLNETGSLERGIKNTEAILNQLKTDDRFLETAYMNYAKGGLYYLKKNYGEAERYLLEALPVITKNDDFTNEHVIYLYLGKTAWQQNKKDKAIAYFSKIEDLFEQKKFLNYELREVYDYLILYYKDTKQPNKQLQATEQLIVLNRQFEKEQQLLTNTLHYELETKKLEESRIILEEQMHNSNNTYSFLLTAAGMLCFVFLGYSIWKSKEHKKMSARFNELLKMQTEDYKYTVAEEVSHTEIFSIENTALSLEKTTADVNDSQKNLVHEENKLDETADSDHNRAREDLSATELRLLDALDSFEREKGFLRPVKLDDLALKFDTNRSTLSALMNKHKGNFATYLNKLRIKQVMIDLQYQPQLRKLSMQGLGETYGFNNGKTFSAQFKSETGLTPTYFIEQLILDERKEMKKKG